MVAYFTCFNKVSADYPKGKKYFGTVKLKIIFVKQP